MFRFAALSADISPYYRGIEAIQPNNEFSQTQDSPTNQATAAAVADLSPVSDLSELILDSGHVACSLHQGKSFSVFDSISPHKSLVSSDHTLSDYERHKLQVFCKSTSPCQLSSVLALRTTDSVIAKMEFIPLTTSDSGVKSGIRLVIFQANASFLIWEWQKQIQKWSFVSAGQLTQPAIAINHKQKDKLSRVVHSVIYHQNSNQVVWLELTDSVYLQLFSCCLSSLKQKTLPETILTTDLIALPLSTQSTTNTHNFQMIPSATGVLILIQHRLNSIYYYSTTSRTISKFFLHANQPDSTSSARCCVTAHPHTQQLLLLTEKNEVFRLDENPESHEPSAELLCVLRYPTIALNLSSVVQFFAFRHVLCVLSEYELLLFTSVDGILLHTLTVPEPQSQTVLRVTQTKFGFGGSGTALYSNHQAWMIQSGPVSTQLQHIVNLPQFLPSSSLAPHSSQGATNPTKAISEISSSYSSSAHSWHNRAHIDHIIGNALAQQPYLNPTSSPSPTEPELGPPCAFALAVKHFQAQKQTEFWFESDLQNTARVLAKLNSYLDSVQPLLETVNTTQTHVHENTNNSAPSTEPDQPSANDLVALQKQQQSSFNHFTPLNLRLLPLLHSQQRIQQQLRSSADQLLAVSPAATNSFNELPIQLHKSVSARLTAAVCGISSERSFQSILLFDSSSCFDFVRHILGLSVELGELAPGSGMPNLLLWNEEMKLAKELSAAQNELTLHSAPLHRLDSLPYFELLSRLYDQLAPQHFIRFISAVRARNGQHENNQHSNGQSSATPVSSISNEFDCQPVLSSVPPFNYLVRATQVLPVLPNLALSTSGKLSQSDYKIHLSQVHNRCWLLVKQNRLLDAVLLRLSLSMQQDDLYRDISSQPTHEEEAIRLMTNTPTTASSGVDELDPSSSACSSDLRSELFHHFLCFWLEKRNRATSLTAADTSLDDLDPRVVQLASPEFTLHSYCQIIEQLLHRSKDSRSQSESSQTAAVKLFQQLSKDTEITNAFSSASPSSTQLNKSFSWAESQTHTVSNNSTPPAPFPASSDIHSSASPASQLQIFSIRAQLVRFAEQLEQQTGSTQY